MVVDDAAVAARLLNLLLRSDEDMLPFYAARTSAAGSLDVAELRALRALLVAIAGWLAADDSTMLRALRERTRGLLGDDEPHGETAGLERAPRSPADLSELSRSVGAANPGEEPTRRHPGAPGANLHVDEDEKGEPVAGPSPVAPAPPPPPLFSEPASSPWTRRAEAEPRGDDLEEAEASLDETGALDLAAVQRVLVAGATPFAKDAAPAIPSPPSTEGAHPDAGFTAAIDLSAIEGLASYPLPPKQPLSAERYAMLVARSEVDSRQRAAVHAELGVADDAHRARIDREMAGAMETSAELRSEVEHHLGRWRRWLREQGGR